MTQQPPIASDTSLPDSLETYRSKLVELQSEYDFEAMKDDRDLSQEFLEELRSSQPLGVTIPEEYGGKGVETKKFLKLCEITSYYSLPFSLLFGINGALFLQPLLQYANASTKDEILPSYLNDHKLGGLMITEPGHGTDALNMRTNFSQSSDSYQISGLKHWAGLTGWADYWIIAARSNKGNGSLGRDISLFICDAEEVEVEEYYSNLGLSVLPYGRNQVNADISASRRLNPDGSGIRMLQDFFHRSRLQFPGMTTGHLRRLRDEALNHCRERNVGGSSLINYGNVREKLRMIQAGYTVSKAMCVYTSDNVTLEESVSGEVIMANSIKALVTDFMQASADAYLQLTGADGYRNDHVAGQSYVDSRPFRIFEGPNDVLYDQVTKKVLKIANKNDFDTFREYAEFAPQLQHLPKELDNSLDIQLNGEMAQARRINLGQIVAHLIAFSHTKTIHKRGYSTEQFQSCKSYLLNTIKTLSFQVRQNDDIDTSFDSVSENDDWTKLTESG
jgi:alkylation response protein AidB-like acyl-CoA dehydrogenase